MGTHTGSFWESMRRMWAERLEAEARKGLTEDGPNWVRWDTDGQQREHSGPYPHRAPFPPTLRWAFLHTRCTYLGRRAAGVAGWGSHPPALLSRAGPGLGSWRQPPPAPSRLRALRVQQECEEET